VNGAYEDFFIFLISFDVFLVHVINVVNEVAYNFKVSNPMGLTSALLNVVRMCRNAFNCDSRTHIASIHSWTMKARMFQCVRVSGRRERNA
jgi:hypothetical protein